MPIFLEYGWGYDIGFGGLEACNQPHVLVLGLVLSKKKLFIERKIITLRK
jgi:hypothetical protein